MYRGTNEVRHALHNSMTRYTKLSVVLNWIWPATAIWRIVRYASSQRPNFVVQRRRSSGVQSDRRRATLRQPTIGQGLNTKVSNRVRRVATTERLSSNKVVGIGGRRQGAAVFTTRMFSTNSRFAFVPRLLEYDGCLHVRHQNGRKDAWSRLVPFSLVKPIRLFCNTYINYSSTQFSKYVLMNHQQYHI